MKSVAVASLFVSVALAATSSLIPDGISSTCTQYLSKLNGNNTLSACTTSLITATKAFQAGSTGAASAADVTSALNAVCSTSTQQACQSSMFRGVLADFYAACPAELASSANDKVIELYDLLYVVVPFRGALCSRDDSGAFCAVKSTAVAGGALANGAQLADVQKALTTTSGAYTIPNPATFASSNVLFLFLQSALASDKLCTTCTKMTLSSFIDFETLMQYAPGLGNSALLSGQPALYKSVTTACGANFLQSAVQAAGSLGEGLVGKSSDAARGVAQLGVAGSALAGLFFALAAL